MPKQIPVFNTKQFLRACRKIGLIFNKKFGKGSHIKIINPETSINIMTDQKSKFSRIHPKKLMDNFFHILDDDWMLVTAGNHSEICSNGAFHVASRKSFNTMTASWGTVGILWNKPIAVCFIRPQRYTYRFIDNSDIYTLCFFTEQERDILDYCGTKSGRDTDKIKDTGLKPLFSGNGGIYYEQARLVLECKKLYSDRFREENFHIQQIINKNYPTKDFHKFFIGEIVTCMVRL